MQLKVFDQTWQEARKPALRWMIALAGVTWILILVHPLFSRLPPVILPVWLQGFIPSAALVDITIWAQQVVISWVLPLLVAFYAAGLGSWLVAGEEERGSLGFLLAAPVRRYRLVFEKALVLVAALLGLTAAACTAVVLALWLMGIPFTISLLLRCTLALMLFGLAVGGLALALGCLTGRRRLSFHITLLAVLLTLVLAHLPDALPLRGIHWISPFYYYTTVIRGGGTGLGLLLVLVLAAFLAAWLGFERRDLSV